MWKITYNSLVSEYNIVTNNGEKVPFCSEYRPGEDDLQAFDLIRRFNFDGVNGTLQGIARVRGSNAVQIAYRLERDTHLTLPTRFVYKTAYKSYCSSDICVVKYKALVKFSHASRVCFHVQYMYVIVHTIKNKE